eukprot:597085-Amphidinium_carterae.1
MCFKYGLLHACLLQAWASMSHVPKKTVVTHHPNRLTQQHSVKAVHEKEQLNPFGQLALVDAAQ